MANAHRNAISSFKRLLLCLRPYEARPGSAAASPSRARKNPYTTPLPVTQCSFCLKERSGASRAAGLCVVCRRERLRASSSPAASSLISRRRSKLRRIACSLLGRLSLNSRVAIDDYVRAPDSFDVALIDPPLPVVRKPASAEAGGSGISLWERRRGKDQLRELKLR